MSASQFDTETIGIEGLPWCQERRDLPVASLTRKNLCEAHNNRLSPVDAEAAKLKRGLRDIGRAIGEKRDSRRFPYRYRIRARYIERWLLKTAVNISMQGETLPGGVFVDGAPLEKYVRIAFGEERFVRPEGLWLAAQVGEKSGAYGSLKFDLWMHTPTARLVGLAVRFHGYRVWLALGGAPEMKGTFLPRLIDAPAAESWVRFRWSPAAVTSEEAQ